MLLSISLVVTAFLFWQNTPGSTYSVWVFWGMLFSFFGDLSMAGLLPWRNHLIGGMVTFGTAHVLYIIGFIQTAQEGPEGLNVAALLAGALLYALLVLLSWQRFIRNPAREAFLNYGALGYGLWVGGMATFALALACSLGNSYWLTALGGLIFVLSDLIIGITDIGGRRVKHAALWVWATYILGQMGIIYAQIQTQ